MSSPISFAAMMASGIRDQRCAVVIPGVPASDADVIGVLVRRTKTCTGRISFAGAEGNKRRAP
jgi:hypothetical protein